MEKLKERIESLKKKKPDYGEILDFYQKVREEQERIKFSIRIEPTPLKKEWKELLLKEGFPLLQREDFPLDIKASINLFESLCRIAKDANPYMSEQVKRIEENLKKIDLKKLLKKKVNEQKVEQVANRFGLDNKILLFLIQNSIKPSIEAGMEQLRTQLGPETWLKGYCPICGSLPYLSLLEEEVGKRYFVCSYCGYQWRAERLSCPFCNNREQASLHYFYAEGKDPRLEDPYRVDLCEKCHHYIKTIDLRKMEVPDPTLEDLATLHLDILASKKGYKRPVPNLWMT